MQIYWPMKRCWVVDTDTKVDVTVTVDSRLPLVMLCYIECKYSSVKSLLKNNRSTNKWSEWFYIRLHYRHRLTVQSYSPGVANNHPTFVGLTFSVALMHSVEDGWFETVSGHARSLDIRWSTCDFLLAFRSNFVPNLLCFCEVAWHQLKNCRL